VLQSTEKTSVRIFELHTGIRSADFWVLTIRLRSLTKLVYDSSDT
jgi:hypothetical protein